jgi:hypothetical protein
MNSYRIYICMKFPIAQLGHSMPILILKIFSSKIRNTDNFGIHCHYFSANFDRIAFKNGRIPHYSSKTSRIWAKTNCLSFDRFRMKFFQNTQILTLNLTPEKLLKSHELP